MCREHGRPKQAQEQAELKGLLERLQVELVNQKQSLEDMAEYVEGTMGEANLCITEWEENRQALKDLVTRANGDTVQMS